MSDLNRNVDGAIKSMVGEVVSHYVNGNKSDARLLFQQIPPHRIALATMYLIREFEAQYSPGDAETFIRSISH
jgi:hypothetical protein